LESALAGMEAPINAEATAPTRGGPGANLIAPEVANQLALCLFGE